MACITGLVALGAAWNEVEHMKKQQAANAKTIATLKKESAATIETLKSENTSKFAALKKDNKDELEKVLGAEKVLLDAKKELVKKTLELEQAKVRTEVWGSRAVLGICAVLTYAALTGRHNS